MRKEVRVLNGSTFVEHAANEIRHRLLTGQIAVDERISPPQLGRELGMSAVPVREALQLLAGEGLVVINGHRGARAAPATIDDLREIYDLRFLLEVDALRKIDMSIFRQQREHIALSLDAIRDAYDMNDSGGFAAAHRAFHLGIYECAGAWHSRVIELLYNASARFQSMARLGDGSEVQRRHALILDALDSGDPSLAADLLGSHLAETRAAASAQIADK